MEQVVVVRAFIESDDKILLLKCSSNEALDTGQYELPGGMIKIGEALEDALSRELKEEIGQAFKDYNLFHAYTYTIDKYYAVVLTYYVKSQIVFKPSLSSKHVDYTWQKREKFNNYSITEELKTLIRYIEAEKVDKKTTTITEVKLYTDGGSRGNPGPSALGYVVYDMEENVVEKGSKYLGLTTNNQAEYQAVKEGLNSCIELGVDKVTVYLDSQLVANQMNGIYKIKNRDLWPIHDAIKKLTPNFKHGVTFNYVPRALNKEADAMVNYELDKNQ